MGTTEKNIATLSIMVQDKASAASVNELLGKHSEVIIGRLGIPYRTKGVSIIVVVVDSEVSSIGSLCGSVGNIPGVSIRSTML
jgi:putative iron-only hydrogenase system regulator